MITKSYSCLKGVLTIDKARYLMELKALLSFMDAGEKTATVNTFRKLFEQVGEEGEQDLIEALGSPVRMVLKLEKSYRNGKLNSFLEQLCAQFVTEAEPEEEVPAPEEENAPIDTEEEPIDNDDASLPSEEEESVAEPQPPAPKVEEFPQWDKAPKAPQETAPPAKERVIEADKGQAAGKPNKPAAKKKNAKKANISAAAEKETSSGGGSPALAILLTPFLILLAALVLALTLLVAAVPGAFCALFSVSGGYFVSYGFFSMSYTPDLLMVIGLGVALLGLAVVFLGLVLRIIVHGFKLDYELLSGTYGKLLGKESVNDA